MMAVYKSAGIIEVNKNTKKATGCQWIYLHYNILKCNIAFYLNEHDKLLW